MVWINLFLIFLSTALAEEMLPQFLTKQPLESLRFITMEGRYAYVVRKPGVLGLVNSFRNNDFMSESSHNDFLITGSRFKQRLIIEVIPNTHDIFNVRRNHKIVVIDYGNSKPREINYGRNAKLHLQDEWITFFNTESKTITIENLLTTKKYNIPLGTKSPDFFIPDVEMITSDSVVFTVLSEEGYSGLMQVNLSTMKPSILYKSNQTATSVEICQDKGYLAIGEFPFEGINRSSKIMQIKLTGSTNLAGFETIYTSNAQDIGQMICTENSIYFVKTIKQHKRLGIKTTEAAQLNLKTHEVKIRSSLSNVTQLVQMDGRVLIPYREDFYVLEGISNISEDKLKTVPDKKEELSLDI